ncbi:thiol-disulfide oxidoreductase DCC family protein [Coraliomargarita algicola]|uniref:thiol-disulfide oxidoreductase DCC family protein n=1 Tax=Coraliomargarita algicola TaxID=3092156 RepID=UPI003CE532B6
MFYDGDCGLCNRSIQFLRQRDRCEVLYFAPIQGETARQCLSADLRTTLSTVIYQRPSPNGQPKILLRSEAVLCALIDTQSSWSWLAICVRCLPCTWRDATYHWIATNRHRFGGKPSCPLPTPREHSHFLP